MGQGRINTEALAAVRAAQPRGVRIFDVVPEDAPEGVENNPDAPGDEFVFKKIDRSTFTAFKAAQRRTQTHGGGGDECTLLARSLLVWPDDQGVSFDALRERAPSITEEFGVMLLADATGGLEVREGKR